MQQKIIQYKNEMKYHESIIIENISFHFSLFTIESEKKTHFEGQENRFLKEFSTIFDYFIIKIFHLIEHIRDCSEQHQT
jgi:3-phosphoglycerate kinase